MAHAVKIVLPFMCSESIISKKFVKKANYQGHKAGSDDIEESQVNHCVLAHVVYAVF